MKLPKNSTKSNISEKVKKILSHDINVQNAAAYQLFIDIKLPIYKKKHLLLFKWV